MVIEGSLFRGGSRAGLILRVALGVLLAMCWPAVTGCSGSAPSRIGSSQNWAAPSTSILGAFEQAAEILGHPVYVPSELPEGTRLLPEDDPPVALEPMSVESVISLAVGEGRIDVLQGVQGDLGDVEGTACGEVEGHPAKVFDLLDGHLVQWEQDGEWYGVYGLELSSETVVRVALSLERG